MDEGHRRKPLRSSPRSHRLPIHLRQSRRHHLRPHQSPQRHRPRPHPQEMLKLRRSALRKAGLSGAKVLAMKDLAKKTIEGVVPTLEEAQKLSDEELVERLISVRGIGAWTVEMFLIFRLGRPDVLPIHDLGVQKGWSVTYGKKHMPKPKELLAFGERWRPYRTVASWYMWRACQRAGNAAMRKIRPAKVRRKPRKKVKSKGRKCRCRALTRHDFSFLLAGTRVPQLSGPDVSSWHGDS